MDIIMTQFFTRTRKNCWVLQNSKGLVVFSSFYCEDEKKYDKTSKFVVFMLFELFLYLL